MRTDGYLRFYQPRPQAARLLICFPHAGGGASAFRAWPFLLDDDTEVAIAQYPGREDRFGEPRVEDMDTLLAQLLTEALPHVARRPFYLLGHSMGGAVAHELAMRLTARGAEPRRLVVSGRQPPSHHPLDSTIHQGSDSELLTELLRLSPDNQALAQEPELAALLLPIVRGDYRLIERYRPGDCRPLDCPITVLAGEHDPELSPEAARAWAEYTRGDCRVHFFPGDHFFIASQRAQVAATVRQAMAEEERI
ncbi:thioesterase II family protein [Bradyrhizobium sp. 2S1]|uniref:thioesterase II family protein n=1 Tax=Bradyrhizobium sp. 2S1 TaxID=1404429 RepID=UPI00140A6893|nr:alpha/beta fold hydrolase [Bradyrhizobium sp. 2S1]MCK7673399.1 alpha/beta fold hydrolase [Bradyrhizobium sp. 2S1]